jgi:hypothetical protein
MASGIIDQETGIEKKKVYNAEVDFGAVRSMNLFAGAKNVNFTKLKARTASNSQVVLQYEPSSMDTLIDRHMYAEFNFITTVSITNPGAFDTVLNIINADSNIMMRQYPISSVTTALNYKVNDFTHSIPLSQIVHACSSAQHSAAQRRSEPFSEPDNMPYQWSFLHGTGNGGVNPGVYDEYSNNVSVGKPYIENIFGSSRSFVDNCQKIEILDATGAVATTIFPQPGMTPVAISTTNGTGKSYRFYHRIFEPIMPIDGVLTHFNEREPGLYGCKNIEFQYVLSANLSRIFEGPMRVGYGPNVSADDHYLFYNTGTGATGLYINNITTTIDSENCFLYVKSYNKSLQYPALSNLFTYPISNYEVNVTTVTVPRKIRSAVEFGANRDVISVSSNVINLQQIPTFIYIYLKYSRRMENGSYIYATSNGDYTNINSVNPPGTEVPDVYPSIESINLTFGDRSGLLSSASKFDLFLMSKKNGSQSTWQQFNGGASCVLVINPAFDLSLQDQLVSQCGEKMTLKVDSIVATLGSASYPLPLVAGNLEFELCVVLHDEGILKQENGQFYSRYQLTNPSETAGMNIYHGGHKLLGGGFFGDAVSWLKGAANKVGSFLSSVATPISNIAKSVASNVNVPIVSDIARTIANVAPTVGQIGNTIKSATGGRFLTAAQLRKRLK